MTTHYNVDSLPALFISNEFMEQKKEYVKHNTSSIQALSIFLNSIEINKQYFKTGIQVKNPKYKKKLSSDTLIIKNFKSSLNKMAAVNYNKLCIEIVRDMSDKKHLYPLLLQYIFEQSLTHHNYCKYYAALVDILHKKFNDIHLLNNQIDLCYSNILSQKIDGDSNYSRLCSKNKQIDQLIGYSIFITELEIIQVISNRSRASINTIMDNMKKLVNEDELYKCVVCLSNIFKVLYVNKPVDEEFIIILNEIKDSVKFMKIKFKIMDILENR